MLPSRRALGACGGKLAAGLALALVGAFAQGCGSAAPISAVPGRPSASISSSTAFPESTGASAIASAMASAALTMEPIPSPAVRPAVTFPPVARVTLSHIGTIAAPRYAQVVSFAGGYVGFPPLADDDETLATWFSVDGQTWKRTIHSKTIVPCTGWTARSDLDDVYVGEAVGGKVVIIAAVADPTPKLCDRTRLVALVSSDGTTWDRSAPFGPEGSKPEWSQQGWMIPGGMEIIVKENDDPPRLSTWRTSDGLAWQQVASRTIDAPDASFGVFGADPDGLRLASSQESEHGETDILASDDGSTWRTVKTLPSGFGVVDAIPPVAVGGPWLIVTANIDVDPERIVLLESADLATWKSAAFPRAVLRSVHLTSAGWIGVGSDPSVDQACDGCAHPDPAIYTSQDGLHWRRQAITLRGDGPTLVDGPAGLLAFEPGDGGQVVSLVELH